MPILELHPKSTESETQGVAPLVRAFRSTLSHVRTIAVLVSDGNVKRKSDKGLC